jgi:eukaryotic-like serine/threonine-protein kinase
MSDFGAGDRETERIRAINVATPPGMPAIDGQGRPVLPGYQMLGQLGEGRMSVVWKAQLIGGFRPVAIKVLRPELMDDSSIVRAFMSEGRLLAELEAENGEHPHIVPVLDAGTFGHHLCILMKFMRFGDLSRYLAERCTGGRVAEPLRFLDLAIQITAGAAYLHDNGLLHRDIKPANVFVDRHGGKAVFRLGDLGMAVDHETAEAAASGTPLYMAPEAFLRQPATAMTDVYALGATFYQLLTGQPPYRSGTLAGLSSLVRSAPVPQAWRADAAIPKLISDLVGICMRKDPGRRYADAVSLLAALRAVRTELGTGYNRRDQSDESTWCGEPISSPT